MKTYTWAIVFVVMVSLFSGSGMASADLVWQTSKETAVSMAKDQGKYILLLAGGSVIRRAAKLPKLRIHDKYRMRIHISPN